MKQIILISLLISTFFAYCQAKDSASAKLENQIYTLKNENIELKNKLSHFYIADSLQKSEISENNKILTQNIKNANVIIDGQNWYINFYKWLFGIIAGVSVLAYLFNIRPLEKKVSDSLSKAELAREKLESKIESFNQSVDEKIEKRFIKFKKSQERKIIEELFKDIESDLPNQRLLAIEKFGSMGQSLKLNSSQIERLLKVVESPTMVSKEKYIIVEQLTQIDDDQIQRFFQLWDNVGVDDIESKNSLIRYYLSKNFANYLNPISSFIKQHISPSVEFNRILDMLPSHSREFFILLNHKDLIDTLEMYSIAEIKKHVKANIPTWNYQEITKDKILDTYLFSEKQEIN